VRCVHPQLRWVVVAAWAALLLTASVRSAASIAADPTGRRTYTIGHSLEGRPIIAVETGDLDARKRLLVVGCIHGNEPAGIALARHLAVSAPPREQVLWIIPDLNPDGVVAGTRGDANGVDLNRNFPWRWRPLGGLFFSGARPLSEPESRAARRLILRVRPSLSIWFHQHLAGVDESGGSVITERLFASFVGLPLLRLRRYPGSAVGWENHALPGTTAFVVELGVGPLTRREVRRFARAVLAVGADGVREQDSAGSIRETVRTHPPPVRRDG
jgi:murein peptide amidase A